MTKVRALSNTLDSHFHTLVRSQERHITHNLSYSGKKKKKQLHTGLWKPHHASTGGLTTCGLAWGFMMGFLTLFPDIETLASLGRKILFSFSSHYFWNFCPITFFSNHTWNYIVSQLNPVCVSQFNSICSHGNWHSYSFV